MSAADDEVFLKRFSLVILILSLFAIGIVFLSLALHHSVDRSEPPARDLAREQRLAPVAGVFAGDSGRAAALAARSAAAAPVMAAAFGGSLDGQLIYDQASASCHISGAAGAPLMVASAWVGRVEQGQATLVANAINGIGAMPARGGRMDLSDEQIEVAVAFMLEALQ